MTSEHAAEVEAAAAAKSGRAGRPAIDFTLPDQDGRPWHLAEFRGQWVVAYFYPADGRPVRRTVLIDPGGTILHHWPEVVPEGRAERVGAKLAELRSRAPQSGGQLRRPEAVNPEACQRTVREYAAREDSTGVLRLPSCGPPEGWPSSVSSIPGPRRAVGIAAQLCRKTASYSLRRDFAPRSHSRVLDSGLSLASWPNQPDSELQPVPSASPAGLHQSGSQPLYLAHHPALDSPAGRA